MDGHRTNLIHSSLSGPLSRFFRQETGPEVVSAYLFGSRSLGRTHRESDVDVGVLLHWQALPTRRERFEQRVLLSSRLIAVLRLNEIDVVILNDTPPPLAARIVTTGHRFFCSDPHVDRAFFRDIQLRAADLAPFLRRARRVKLAVFQR